MGLLSNKLRAARNRLPFFVRMHILDKKRNSLFYKIISIVSIPLGLLYEVILMMASLKEPVDFKYQLVVVAIMKDEASYVEEWINYYLSVGVDHIYIYDNNSSDNLYEITQKYKMVSYIKYPGKLRQLDAYNDALNNLKFKCKYILIVDADEFVFSPKNLNFNLYKKIDPYFQNNVGGVGINWLIFGSAHLAVRPKGLVTNNYLYRSEKDFYKNKHLKAVINPRKILGYTTAHVPVPLPKYHIVNIKNEKIDGSQSKTILIDDLRVNHYFTKSRAEFLKKRARGMADNDKLRDKKEFKIHDRNDVFDDSMKEYNNFHHLR